MVKEEKINKVVGLKEMIKDYRVVGIVDMHKMPSKQLQEIRKKLGGEAAIMMVKKSIIKFALEKIENNEIKKLENVIENQPAIILSNLGPFKLYILLSKLRFPAFAKGGDIAIDDIKVSAGPTALLPGPAISEFQRAGIQVGVEDGKIAVRKDATVVNKGKIISEAVSNVLRKLNIKPMLVELNVVALVDGTNFYRKDVLDLVNTFPTKFGEAFNNAMNLSVSIAYPTKENVKFLLSKCFNAAIAIQNISSVKLTEKKLD